MDGNSSALTPRMFPSVRRHCILTTRLLGLSSILTGADGSELTNSCSRRAGTATRPSCSMSASIQQLMLNSRLVADSLSLGPSVASRTLLRIGIVLRVETARPTIAKPLLRLSCGQVSFTPAYLLSNSIIRSGQHVSRRGYRKEEGCLDGHQRGELRQQIVLAQRLLALIWHPHDLRRLERLGRRSGQLLQVGFYGFGGNVRLLWQRHHRRRDQRYDDIAAAALVRFRSSCSGCGTPAYAAAHIRQRLKRQPLPCRQRSLVVG